MRVLRFLFSPFGRISGGNYLLTGLGLFLLKYLLDLTLARLGFGIQWYPTDYFLPRSGRILPGVDTNARSLLPLLLVAIPFIWIGVNLTSRRVKTLGWPSSLVCLFFVPYLNFLLFGALGLTTTPALTE